MAKTVQRILIGDVRKRLDDIPTHGVHTIVTSPPYYGLRDYGVPGQVGAESTVEGYIESIVDVFRDLRWVLHDSGTIWLNLGDSYAGGGGYYPDAPSNQNGSRQSTNAGSIKGTRAMSGFKQKDLMMIPARVAIALQEDGWYLRAENVWAKPNPMPESVRDRTTRSHEFVYMFAKQPRYFYDAEAVAEAATGHDPGTMGNHAGNKLPPETGNGRNGSTLHSLPGSRNLRSVWTITPEPYSGAHFAAFPRELPRRCIKAGSSEYGCCPACLSPWRRVVERTEYDPDAMQRTPKQAEREALGIHCNRTRLHETGWQNQPQPSSVTTGWEPTCSCFGQWEETTEPNPAYEPGNEWTPEMTYRRVYIPGPDDPAPIPCTVLDPFLGSGTTLEEAERLGRDGYGIELNPDYAELARKRIIRVNPLFTNVVLV